MASGHERDLQGTYGSQTDDLATMHARHYSPGLARFLVPDALRGDPRRPQTFNLFAYVTGNPSTYTDPWGMDGDRFAGEIVVVAQLPDQDGSDLAFGLAYLRFLLYGPTTPPIGIDGGGGARGGDPASEGAEFKRDRPCSWAHGQAQRWRDPGRPDFLAAGFNLPVPLPLVGKLLSVYVQGSLDRYGRLYVGVGPSVGRPPTLSGSVMSGSLARLSTPSGDDLSRYMTGWNVTAAAGNGGAAAIGWWPGSGIAVQGGYGSPQAGASLTYSWEMDCLGEGW